MGSRRGEDPAKALPQAPRSLQSDRGSPLMGNQGLFQGHLTQARSQGMETLTTASIYLPGCHHSYINI